MVSMKKHVLENLGMKIGSLLIAIIIWIVVANVDDYKITKQISGIEIEFINGSAITEKNKVYEVPKGTTVDVVVKGRRSIVEHLSNDDFKAVADLSKMSVTNAVAVKVSPVSSHIGKELLITHTDNAVVVAVEDKLQTQFPITVATTSEVAEGYAICSKTATPNLITVEGAESVVKNIHEVVVTVDVKGASHNLTAVAPPVFIDGNGEIIDSEKVEYDVKMVDVSIEVLKTKEIPVKISEQGQVREGYAISSIDYQPTSVEVVGIPAALSKIDELLIEDIDVTNCYMDIEEAINIAEYLPEGVTLVGNNPEIMVKIAIEKVEEKQLHIGVKDINIVGKHGEYTYLIKTPINEDIMIKGLNKDVETVDITDLLPSIDVTGYSPGVYTFTVKFRDLNGVEVLDEIKLEVEIRR